MPELNSKQFQPADEFSGQSAAAIQARDYAPDVRGKYSKTMLPFAEKLSLKDHVTAMGNHFLNMAKSNPDVAGDDAGNALRKNFRDMADYHARYLLGDSYGKETPGVSDNSVRERAATHGNAIEALGSVHRAASHLTDLRNDFFAKTGSVPSGTHALDEIKATNHRFAKRVSGLE